MNDIDVTVYFNEHRLAALDEVLNDQGRTIEGVLRKCFEETYASLVPEEKREEIEALIRQEEAQAQREAEAARRFAVIHFHEDGDDFHFTPDLRNTLYSAAYRYRNFLQEDVGKLTLDSLAVAFGEHQPIDDLTFSILCDAMEHDERITALLEFDFDSGIISVKEQADPEWRSYRLKDVSTAIYRAERRNGLSLQTREQIFEDALHGQEIQQKEPEEITPQIQGM